MAQPRIFIGSSSESLPVVEALTRGLARYGKVIPWSQRNFFRPGLYYLDNIIHEIPQFDFAVFIFGPDDTVDSRGKSQDMPRDNVIFEFGYAMASLDRKRVFHLVPKGPGVNIKVMSDLAGMKPWEYQLSLELSEQLTTIGAKWRESDATEKQPILSQLKEVLNDPCRLIGDTIKELGPLTPFDRAVAEGPQYVSDVYQDLLSELTKPDANEVLNIALDMEQAWPALRDRFLLNERCPPVRWRTLVINPKSPLLQALNGPSFSTSVAAAMIENLRTVMKQLGQQQCPSQVNIECRAYDSPPSIHGFLVNDQVAYVSLCGLSPSWAEGTGAPYLRFREGRCIPAADHMVKSFGTIFEYHWKRAKQIWPPPKQRRPR